MIEEIKKLWELGVDLIPAVKKNPKAGGAWGDRDKMGWMEVADKITNEGFDSVAIRMGKRSDGLIGLDIDEKYNPGFGAYFLGILRDLKPDVFEKLWLEQTPSGGFHVLWRYKGDVGTCNLVSREATRDELLDKPKTNKYCFVELKGNGSLCTVAPTKGYKTLRFAINELSESEHIGILELAKSFDTVPKYEPKKKYNVDEGYYSENPFECFDKSEMASRVLDDLGWIFVKSSGSFNWYGKPKSNGKDVHATFNCKTGLYKIFGTSVGEGKSYSPSNILCLLEFGEDKKKLYQWLVAKGYGKINPKVEENIIKKAAKSGSAIPNNVSGEGKERLKEEKVKAKEKYPYGIFWKEVEDGFKISREALYDVARNLGFRKHGEEIIFMDGHVARKVIADFFYETMKCYIKEDSEELLNCYEAFLQASGKFTISRLDAFDETMILSCEKYVSYLFYRNCYLKITSEEIEILEYKYMDKLIWEENIKNRDFIKHDGFRKGLYWEFLNNAIGCSEYLMQCIGHYAHNYRDSEAYCVIAVESCDTGKGGGAGKNIFWDLFSEITTCMSMTASMVKFDNNLLQSWDYQRVLHISDLTKNFDLRFLKDAVNGSISVNKKYINEYKIPISKMPKVCCSTNYSYDDSDGGVKRRTRGLEFTDFYIRRGGVNKVHGKMFPKDWDENDYIGFDNTMVYAIQRFLLNNCEISRIESSFGAFKKQFEQKYTHLYDFIVLNLGRYCELGNVETVTFMNDYKIFCNEENINIKFQYRSSRINEALEEYCLKMGYEFVKDSQWKDNGIRKTGKKFGKIGEIKKEEIIEDLPF